MEIIFYKYVDDSDTLSHCARVDDYTSFVFTRSFAGVGSWQMVLPLGSKNIPNILDADIISVRNRVAGLITKISKSVSDSTQELTINGIELKGLVRSRVVKPQAGEAYVSYTNMAASSIVNSLLSSQLMLAETDRRIPGTMLNTAQTAATSYMGRYSSLEEDIGTLCEEYGFGYCASLNSLREIRWDIFNGIDRRQSQSENSKMVFSYANDTVESSSLEISKNTVNSIYTAGQGEGAERIIAEVGTATGLRRFEGFVDARDVSDSALLIQRGNEKLSEYGDSTVFTARVSENLVNKYTADFNLGDLCTVTEEIGGVAFSLDARITSITECYEENAFTIDITFGYDKSGLANVISRLKNETKALLKKE